MPHAKVTTPAVTAQSKAEKRATTAETAIHAMAATALSASQSPSLGAVTVINVAWNSATTAIRLLEMVVALRATTSRPAAEMAWLTLERNVMIKTSIPATVAMVQTVYTPPYQGAVMGTSANQSHVTTATSSTAMGATEIARLRTRYAETESLKARKSATTKMQTRVMGAMVARVPLLQSLVVETDIFVAVRPATTATSRTGMDATTCARLSSGAVKTVSLTPERTAMMEMLPFAMVAMARRAPSLRSMVAATATYAAQKNATTEAPRMEMAVTLHVNFQAIAEMAR